MQFTNFLCTKRRDSLLISDLKYGFTRSNFQTTSFPTALKTAFNTALNTLITTALIINTIGILIDGFLSPLGGIIGGSNIQYEHFKIVIVI
jgi:hypothetical protein